MVIRTLIFNLFLLLFSVISFAQSDSLWTSDELPEEWTIYNIHISGNRLTRSAIILRELSVQKEEIVLKNELAEIIALNTDRLYSLSFFNEVKIDWEQTDTLGGIIKIKVKERIPIYPEGHLEFADRNMNVWWKEHNHDFKRLNLGLTLMMNNFRGNKEELSVTGQIGYTKELGLIYNRPYIDKNQKHGLGIYVTGMVNKEIPYNTQNNKLSFFHDANNPMLYRYEAGPRYIYRPGYAFTHKLNLTWQYYKINDLILDFNPDYLGNRNTQLNIWWLEYRMDINRVDNWNYPVKGYRFIGAWNTKLLMNDHSFFNSIHLQYDNYQTLPQGFYTGFIFRGKYAFNEPKAYILQQNLGYQYDYIRGYEYYVIDGRAFALARAELKKSLFNRSYPTSIRYFEVFPIRIFAKIFVDGGISYSGQIQNNLLGNKFLYSAGFGLDIVTLYDLKLRIEYTFNALGEKGLFINQNGM